MPNFFAVAQVVWLWAGGSKNWATDLTSCRLGDGSRGGPHKYFTLCNIILSLHSSPQHFGTWITASSALGLFNPLKTGPSHELPYQILMLWVKLISTYRTRVLRLRCVHWFRMCDSISHAENSSTF